jgi:hypothetical protein
MICYVISFVILFVFQGLREKYDENPTLLGEFMYDSEGPTLQYFEAKVTLINI